MKLKFLATLMIFACADLYAEIYKTIDENGKVIFSDNPKASSTRVEIEEINVTETIFEKDWPSLKEKSSLITLDLEKTTILAVIDMIASYAYKNDGVTISHQGLVSTQRAYTPINITYIKQPWAAVVDDFSKKYDLKIEFSDDVIVIVPLY